MFDQLLNLTIQADTEVSSGFEALEKSVGALCPA